MATWHCCFKRVQVTWCHLITILVPSGTAATGDSMAYRPLCPLAIATAVRGKWHLSGTISYSILLLKDFSWSRGAQPLAATAASLSTCACCFRLCQVSCDENTKYLLWPRYYSRGLTVMIARASCKQVVMGNWRLKVTTPAGELCAAGGYRYNAWYYHCFTQGTLVKNTLCEGPVHLLEYRHLSCLSKAAHGLLFND